MVAASSELPDIWFFLYNNKNQMIAVISPFTVVSVSVEGTPVPTSTPPPPHLQPAITQAETFQIKVNYPALTLHTKPFQTTASWKPSHQLPRALPAHHSCSREHPRGSASSPHPLRSSQRHGGGTCSLLVPTGCSCAPEMQDAHQWLRGLTLQGNDTQSSSMTDEH